MCVCVCHTGFKSTELARFLLHCIRQDDVTGRQRIEEEQTLLREHERQHVRDDPDHIHLHSLADIEASLEYFLDDGTSSLTKMT
jgi:hypothetical protein